MTWFVVRSRMGVLTPYHVRFSNTSTACLPDQAETGALHRLIDMVSEDDTRIDFSQPWRSFSSFTDGQPQGPPLSKVLGACFHTFYVRLSQCHRFVSRLVQSAIRYSPRRLTSCRLRWSCGCGVRAVWMAWRTT